MRTATSSGASAPTCPPQVEEPATGCAITSEEDRYTQSPDAMSPLDGLEISESSIATSEQLAGRLGSVDASARVDTPASLLNHSSCCSGRCVLQSPEYESPPGSKVPSGDSGKKNSGKKNSALSDCSALSSRIEELTAEFEGLGSPPSGLAAPEPLTTVPQQPRPSPWRTIYRIEGRAYLGPPQWQHTDAGIGLVGSMPIRDVARYLDRHPEIQFVVFREYLPETVPEELDLDEYSLPEPQSQALWFSSTAAFDAVTRLAQTYPELETSLSHVNLHDEICEPYVILFHMFDKWDMKMKQLAETDQGILESILECITELIGPRYQRAIEAISCDKISREDLIFLPKPGDILVQSTPELTTFMVSSWAAQGGMDSSHCGDTASSDVTNSKWHISGWSWTMSGGNLFKTSRTKEYSIGLGTYGEVDINTLEVYPLRHASTEVRKYLRKRGHCFWRYYHESEWVAYPRKDSVPDEPETVRLPSAESVFIQEEISNCFPVSRPNHGRYFRLPRRAPGRKVRYIDRGRGRRVR